MKIHVVDNGGQWTHREWRVLRDIGVETKIVPNDIDPEILKKENIDALVLSGGSPSISYELQKLGRTGEYLSLGIPVLGICVGAQFIALNYGGKVGPAKIPEYGKTRLYVMDRDDIFENLPGEFYVWENHNDEVKELPKGFVHLAKSENCYIQAFKHEKELIYGVQFHPEVENTEYGIEIFKNFIKMVKR